MTKTHTITFRLSPSQEWQTVSREAHSEEQAKLDIKFENEVTHNQIEFKTLNYKDILSTNIKSEIDTDHGVLRAFWKTTKDLIEAKTDRRECLKFLQEFGRQFGEFKMVEARGDMLDAGLLAICADRSCTNKQHGHSWLR